MSRLAVWSGVASVIVATALGIGVLTRNVSPPPTKITTATADWESGLVLLANRQGYFQDEGLDVTIMNIATGRGQAAQELPFQGGADLATVAETPIAFGILAGKQPVILATILTEKPN
jgi:ABC-type nitrate/sulfonate/bicarbonate transport system substrate-binding protein